MDRKLKRQQTKLKRKTQTCKVYQVKVDYSKLSTKSRNHLKSIFLEGKWLYNSILASPDIKKYDTKVKEVLVKVQDSYETRQLEHISSQMKQSLRDRMFQSILNLSSKKKLGYKVGKLQFTPKLSCIPLNQHNNTYTIFKEQNYIKLQGLRQKLKVSGLEQIPNSSEIATANLIKKGNDYFFHITTYQEKVIKIIPDENIGIDFGCDTQLTLSNGVKISYEIPVRKSLKRISRKIDKHKRPKSKNKTKDYIKREKLYEHLNNQKKDIKNKIVSCLTNNFKVIAFQDENLKGWASGGHGKKIQNTALGGIIRDLKHKSYTPIVVNRFFPSTQLCPQCGCKTKLTLDQRTYVCKQCGYTEDRDVKSAQCILTEGLRNLALTNGKAVNKCCVPTECREVTPREIGTSVFKLFSNLSNRIKVSFCQNSQVLT